MIDLSGKVALVTGGSRGIGKATCAKLAEAGCAVAVTYHTHRQGADEIVATITTNGGRAYAVGGDLRNSEATAQLYAEVEQHLGQPDIVVANAGIWKRAPIDDMSPSQWTETMAANLDSVYHTCHHAAAFMKRRGSGNLILIGSTAGQRGEAFYSHYAATKGAIMSLTRSLATELGPHGINVNCVAPGWVLTEMTEATFADEAYRREVTDSIPVRRIATPDDVAGPILFLASPLARHIQGQVLGVNGGTVFA